MQLRRIYLGEPRLGLYHLNQQSQKQRKPAMKTNLIYSILNAMGKCTPIRRTSRGKRKFRSTLRVSSMETLEKRMLLTGLSLSQPMQTVEHGGTFIAGQASYADVNGDSKADLIFQGVDNQFWLSRSNGTGFDSPRSVMKHGGTFVAGQASYADVNGDSKADLIFQGVDNQFWLSRSNGTGFDSPQSVMKHGGTFVAGQASYADVNGDSKADLIFRGVNNRFWLSLSQGTSFSGPQITMQHGGTFIPGQAYYRDVNGDAKAELIFQGNDNKFWMSRFNQWNGPITATLDEFGDVFVVKPGDWGWSLVDSGVKQMVNTGDGFLYVLHKDGVLRKELTTSYGGGQIVDVAVKTMESSPDGSLYFLSSNGILRTCSKFGTIPSTLATGVVELTKDSSANLNYLLRPLTLTPSTAGSFFSTQLSAAGGALANHFVGTGVPLGVTISDGGFVSGTRTVAGTYIFKVRATNIPSPYLIGTQSISFYIVPDRVASVTLSAPTAVTSRQSFNVTISAKDRFENIWYGQATITGSNGMSLSLNLLKDSATTVPIALTAFGSVWLTVNAQGISTGTNIQVNAIAYHYDYDFFAYDRWGKYTGYHMMWGTDAKDATQLSSLMYAAEMSFAQTLDTGKVQWSSIYAVLLGSNPIY